MSRDLAERRREHRPGRDGQAEIDALLPRRRRGMSRAARVEAHGCLSLEAQRRRPDPDRQHKKRKTAADSSSRTAAHVALACTSACGLNYHERAGAGRADSCTQLRSARRDAGCVLRRRRARQLSLCVLSHRRAQAGQAAARGAALLGAGSRRGRRTTSMRAAPSRTTS